MNRRSLLAACLAVSAALAAAPSLAVAGIGATQRCEVTIQVSAAEPLGALELRVDYSQADGEFVDDGEEVECVGLIPGAYASARNDQAGQELDLGMISAIGAAVPGDFWRCIFEGDQVPTAGDFDVIVDDALDPELSPVAAEGSIGEIACASQAVCGNGVIEGNEECDDVESTVSCEANCKLTYNTQRCGVAFRVTGTGPVGGVQFRVDYAASSGEFEGSGLDVHCTEALESALTVVDDRDGDKELRLALISASGLALPADLWECVFVTNATPLQLETFQFENIIATNQALANVPVNIAAVTSSCIFGPYCGDNHVDPGEACDDGNQAAGDACTNACTVAVCGDGVVRIGVEQCDDANSTAGDCCANNCTAESSSTVCRAAVGVCDVAENCTGSSGTCPADAKKSTVCRASAGVCDLAEVCDGSSNVCPANLLTTAVCRAAAGLCDLTESCTGSSATCPANVFQTAGVACASDENVCTNDQCNGSGVCANLSNSLACNDGLFCNGTDTCAGGTCSIHAGNTCPGADSDGDCSESCSESTDNCTANDPDTSTCNDGNSSTLNDQCVSGLCVQGSPIPVCGDANGNGMISASDALQVLTRAVGQPIVCHPYLCDTDNNGSIVASDAQRVLLKAVGQNVPVTCPPKP